MQEANKEEILEEVLEDLENAQTEKQDEQTESCETEQAAETEQTTEEADAPEEEKEASDDNKKGFFKKKKDKKDEQIEELTDRVRRQMAEFENFRKRSEKEKSQMFDMGAKSIIEKILPVIDNFERGLAAVTEDEKETPFAQGVELVYKQLLTSFDELGVKPIEAVGKEFDPNLHNAVMMVDDDSLESGTVAEEMQQG